LIKKVKIKLNSEDSGPLKEIFNDENKNQVTYFQSPEAARQHEIKERKEALF